MRGSSSTSWRPVVGHSPEACAGCSASSDRLPDGPMTWTLEKILRAARKFEASDVHLVRGVAPALRVNGDIRVLEGEPLTDEILHELLEGMVNDKQRKIFEEQWQLCFSHHWPGLGRFRVSVYLHAGC